MFWHTLSIMYHIVCQKGAWPWTQMTQNDKILTWYAKRTMVTCTSAMCPLCIHRALFLGSPSAKKPTFLTSRMVTPKTHTCHLTRAVVATRPRQVEPMIMANTCRWSRVAMTACPCQIASVCVLETHCLLWEHLHPAALKGLSKPFDAAL